MEGPVIDVGIAHQNADARRIDGFVGEDRKFLEDDLEVGILGDQRGQVRHGSAAVATVVVEELDQGDVAIGIADDDLVRRIEDGIAVLAHGRLGAGLLFHAQRILKRNGEALQQLGIAHEIGFDHWVQRRRVERSHLWRCQRGRRLLRQNLLDNGTDGHGIGLRRRLVQQRKAQGSGENTGCRGQHDGKAVHERLRRVDALF